MAVNKKKVTKKVVKKTTTHPTIFDDVNIGIPPMKKDIPMPPVKEPKAKFDMNKFNKSLEKKALSEIIIIISVTPEVIISEVEFIEHGCWMTYKNVDNPIVKKFYIIK